MTTNSDEVIDCGSSGSAPIVFSKDDDDDVWDDRELIEQYNNAINIAYKTVGAAVVDNNPKTKKKVNRKQQLLSQSQESQGYTGYTDPVMPSPIPRIAPPPPPGFAHVPPPSEQSALSSMLMSWYMSGYHTGYYQAQQDLKEKATTAHCYNTQEEELDEDEEYTDPR